MAIELWTPAELIEIQQDNRVAPQDGFWSGITPSPTSDTNVPNPFLTLGVFNQEVTFETQKIYFDQLPIRDRRMAPFVAPNVQGRVMSERGRSMASFSPAYLKPKHIVTPDRAMVRRPGEAVNLTGGSLTLEQRYDAIVASCMADERAFCERRWDWMAAMALIYGAVTVAGEDYPSVTVDFQRDAALTLVLGGQARWDMYATANPLADIAEQRTTAFTLGQSPVGKLVFGTFAWGCFIRNAQVLALLNNQIRNGGSTFQAFDIGTEANAEYKGFIQGSDGGRLDLWVYSNEYEDENGDMLPYLDPRDVVGVGNNVQGVRCFGAIMDKKAGLRAINMFPKMWDNDDPPGTYTMTQSAPLMVPGNPNNSFRIRVTDTVVQV